jgi:hypothetical protein
VRPKASQSAKDLLIELPERDTRRLLKKATARREAGIFSMVLGVRPLESMREGPGS